MECFFGPFGPSFHLLFSSFESILLDSLFLLVSSNFFFIFAFHAYWISPSWLLKGYGDRTLKLKVQ